MKTILVVLTSGLFLAAVPSPAQTIGVQFPAYYGSPGAMLNGSSGNPQNYTAGVVPQQNWNVAVAATGGGDGMITGDVTNANLVDNNNNSVSSTLMTASGGTSGVTFDLSGANTERYNSSGTFASQGDNNLATGGLFNTNSSVSLSLSGLNASDSYTLVAYMHADYFFYGSQTIAVSFGSSTYYLTMNGASSLTSWTQATSTAMGSPTLANYVEFTGLTGADFAADSLLINNVSGSAGGSGLSGFQLIDNGPVSVPEPSTAWLSVLGFLGWAGHLCRKRMTQI